ncbi:MAG: alpha/beta hydrolase [Burkholderiales bacterium]|jgi:pimeloyl-ACP methyl ester carboxylesterase|nr:alpha/beta hydrolase [Burkholderiales bacterium]
MQPSFVTVQGRRLEYRRIASSRPSLPTLVFLHEGLGALAMWRDFPDRAAAATGCGALVYSRYGYGRSDVLERAHRVDYMHREALDFLPELLDKLGIDDPLPVGHSDGASIAIIYAGARHSARGLVLLAPHVFVEAISVESIAKAKIAFETTDLPQKLARYHADAAKTFYGWNDIWLAPDFRAWNIEAFLPDIRVPILAIQGEDDEYGTMRQIDAIAAQARGPVELVKLPNCGHSPHRDQPDATLAALSRFVAELARP